MSSNNSSGSNPTDSFSLMNLCGRVIFYGFNFNDWIRNIRMVTRYEDKEYVLDKELKEIDESSATPLEIADFRTHERDATKVACIMLATMTAELQKSYDEFYPFEMHMDLMDRYHQSACQERYEIISSMITTRMKDGEPITGHMQKMQRFVDRLLKLNVNFPEELDIDIILHSLPPCYDQVRMTYHMNKEEVTLNKLQGLLKTAKSGLKGKSVVTTPTPTTTPVLAIGKGKGKKRKTPSKGHKGKSLDGSSSSGTKGGPATPSANPKEAECFYCHDKGHWKRSYPKYLHDVKDGKVKPTHGLKISEDVEHGKINLIMGNRKASPVTKIGVYSLLLSSGLMLDLNKCCYSSEMARNIISFHALPCDGVYETVLVVDNLGNNVLHIDSSTSLDKASLWHCRLGHVDKNRIGQLQKAGVLESFDLKSDDSCKSCLLGKMTKSPFTGTCARGEGLLDLIHTDVCGPFKTATRDASCFYEVEIQLGRNIKMLRSDRGGEYLSTEFLDYLKECGIVSQLTPPKTPQLNGVAERRNRTLLDMVRSMMSRALLPISFWGYALETAAHILNLVPTKNVAKTPHEMWTGKAPTLYHIKERGVFREREFISQGNSGRQIDLEELQESSGEGTSNPSNQPEEEAPVEPTDESVPLRRSTRVRNTPEHYYGFHITGEGDTFISDSTLLNLDEPNNYKEAMAGPESAKWKEVMDSEIQSMYDNQVWNLVDNVPGRKTVG
ncbi:unnamed protein product [Lactuca virosa]|uniref:Integrase catalytic domain-containing protein n=1 Tax=Lactuca virosa TaxID=75947 RepID=A0AAU9MC90_9ASTR|nr:unnamed protein product [Lactuca virosa]